VIGALTGCDVAAPGQDDASRGIDAPALEVLAVNATSTYAGAIPERIALAEAEITANIATSASFDIRVSRFLLPHKVIRQSICLRPVTEVVLSIDDCRDPFQAFAEPEYDPVLRSVVYRLPTDARLESDTSYRLTVFATQSTDESGLFAFDGAPLARSYVYDFKTRPAADATQNEPLPSAARYCEAVACFDSCLAAGSADTAGSDCVTACDGSDAEKQLCAVGCCHAACGFDAIDSGRRFGGMLVGCAFGECHQPTDPTSPNDAMGLNLANVDALLSTAIGKVAHQSQQGGNATTATAAPLRFGRAMPIIDAGNPGNSYLLYKLLIQPLNFAHASSGSIDPALAIELRRLNAGAIVGLPMPMSISGGAEGMARTGSGAAADAEASQRAVQNVANWIAHGAVTSCPP
jgi:hypothetical protein